MLLPFRETDEFRIYKSRINNNFDFLIVGFFTINYKEEADRLISSFIKFEYDFSIFITPTVHNSISPKGSNNPTYTKPNFINFCQDFFKKNILYLDCDMVICSQLDLIIEKSKGNYDFGFLNWLAIDDTSAFSPAQGGIENSYKNIYKFSHSIDYISNDQLIVSGAVQYWGKSDNSKKLLESWQNTILENEGTPDDHCLDYSFNNLDIENNLNIKKFWLPKSYARYAWWIFDKPIINHPQFPYNGSSVVQIKEEHGMKRFYVEKMTLKIPKRMLNENEILNYDDKKVFSIKDGALVFERLIDSPLWINS